MLNKLDYTFRLQRHTQPRSNRVEKQAYSLTLINEEIDAVHHQDIEYDRVDHLLEIFLCYERLIDEQAEGVGRNILHNAKSACTMSIDISQLTRSSKLHRPRQRMPSDRISASLHRTAGTMISCTRPRRVSFSCKLYITDQHTLKPRQDQRTLTTRSSKACMSVKDRT